MDHVDRGLDRRPSASLPFGFPPTWINNHGDIRTEGGAVAAPRSGRAALGWLEAALQAGGFRFNGRPYALPPDPRAALTLALRPGHRPPSAKDPSRGTNSRAPEWPHRRTT